MIRFYKNRFLAVKKERKQILADYIKEHNGIEVDVDSIFDVQVKRLHAYKSAQLLNILHVIYLYQEMKSNPHFRIYPHTLSKRQVLITSLKKLLN